MERIMIKCPDTGAAVHTGVLADKPAFESPANVMADSHLACPVCGKTHSWRKADAWLEMSDGASAAIAGRRASSGEFLSHVPVLGG